LGTLPKEGDSCEVTLFLDEDGEQSSRFRLAVTELDGRRAARLRLTNLGPVEPG